METPDPHARAQEMAALILKHLRGETTPKEESELQQWLDVDERNRVFIKSLEDEKSFRDDLVFLSEMHVSEAWRKVRPKTVKRAVLLHQRVLRAAAVILLALASGAVLYTFLFRNQDVNPGLEATINETLDIAPGGDKAILELADGSTISLEDAGDGEVRSENGTRINKQNNTLIYDAPKHVTLESISYNKVSTPTGGQFRIVLPDGTKVWLNAQSSLRYPTIFSGDQREVEMTGEVYFEVAPDVQRPFQVKVNEMTVSVLGTHFNIMAYENESSVNTTLVEGSVKVSQRDESRILAPGQQAQAADWIELVTANIEETLAWKNGFFQFSNSSLESILRQLERWYGAEVIYDNVPRMHFTGSISRDNNISQVLKMLELTGGITFEIGPDRKVYIMTDSD